MSRPTLTIKGLEEFKQFASQLRDTHRAEAEAIVLSAANQARAETFVAYPSKSGSLRAGLMVTLEKTGSAIKAVLSSLSDHAAEYEKGSKRRSTKRGWDRGVMPRATEGRAMIPIVRKWRARMRDDLVEMVERAGFKIDHR